MKPTPEMRGRWLDELRGVLTEDWLPAPAHVSAYRDHTNAERGLLFEAAFRRDGTSAIFQGELGRELVIYLERPRESAEALPPAGDVLKDVVLTRGGAVTVPAGATAHGAVCTMDGVRAFDEKEPYQPVSVLFARVVWGVGEGTASR